MMRLGAGGGRAGMLKVEGESGRRGGEVWGYRLGRQASWRRFF